MKGGEDEEIFRKSALKVVQAKNDSKGIWRRIVKTQAWDLEESRILELKEGLKNKSVSQSTKNFRKIIIENCPLRLVMMTCLVAFAWMVSSK